MDPMSMEEDGTRTARLLNRRSLTNRIFEIQLSRPHGFRFLPGQWVRLFLEASSRDYSLVSAPEDAALAFCIRQVHGGRISPLLAEAEKGASFSITGPHGYFIYRNSNRRAVFVATGVGIAPFVSMARAGIAGFILLHGVRKPTDLIYGDVFSKSAERYIPCISEPGATVSGAFHGRVTDFLEKHLWPDAYDFYLCGRSEMIRDATLIADERFPGAPVYAETFY